MATRARPAGMPGGPLSLEKNICAAPPGQTPYFFADSRRGTASPARRGTASHGPPAGRDAATRPLPSDCPETASESWHGP